MSRRRPAGVPDRASLVIAERPDAGTPRPYSLPPVERTRLSNGLRLVLVHVPGRPLLSATLAVASGAADEPPAEAGSSVLMARALTEGTEVRDAVAFTEATERLGASIHAEAGWDSTSASLEVPAARLGPTVALLAEMLRRPAFPPDEIGRLRDERLNDLLQAQADPRRRAEEAFVATIYDPASPYHRPAAGTRETVSGLDPDAVRRAHARNLDPSRATFVVGGDLSGLDVPGIASEALGDWVGEATVGEPAPIAATPALDERLVRVVHRPGSVQTEIRVGHPGAPRRIEDYHAVAVLSAILGGLFNSRLNRKLREEKGYTYGASAGFDFRRAAGPFGARAAVNTEVTVPALLDLLAELERIREGDVSEAELAVARDYLVGVFPLRFETPGALVGALAGLAVHGLPDDELVGYRDRIEAVTAAGVRAAATSRIHPDRLGIVLVGDADAFLPDLEGAALGRMIVDRDPEPEVASGS